MKALARREEMLEQRFVHEQTMDFKFEARRNKALAAWASSLMGMTEDEGGVYQDMILSLSLRAPSDKAIVERVSLDLAMAGAAVSQKQIRAKLDVFWAEAHRELA